MNFDSIPNPKVILLIGPPLSGKDTFLSNNNFSDYKVICRDNILMDLAKTNDYNKAWSLVNQKLVDKKLNELIYGSIYSRENVIINMTNLTRKSRNRHLSKFPKSDYYKIAIVFPKLDLVEYINRNERRNLSENKFIPIKSLLDMIECWEDVDNNELFDEIIKL